MLSFLEQKGYQVLAAEWKTFFREARDKIIDTITQRVEEKFMALEQNVERLSAAVTTEVAQLTESNNALATKIQELIDANTENAELRAQLEALQGDVTATGEALDNLSSVLESDDPAPAPDPVVEPDPIDQPPADPGTPEPEAPQA